MFHKKGDIVIPKSAAKEDDLMNLVLEAGGRSIGMDHQGGRYQSAVNQAFRSENDRDACLRGCGGDDGPGAFEEVAIGRRHRFAGSAIARDEAFGKADDSCFLEGGFLDGLLGERDRLLRAGGEPEIRECDSIHVHGQGAGQ